MRIRPRLLLAAAGLWLAGSSPAQATWSIVAVDTSTGEAGVAVASCVPPPYDQTVLPYVPAVVPGVGALAAQGLFDAVQRDRAAAMLADDDATPAEILATLQRRDEAAEMRQYGIATFDHAAAVTGTALPPWADEMTGATWAVQGNVVVGPEVLQATADRFVLEDPCDGSLGDRLLSALEAGAASGGDARCDPRQSASTAVLVVAGPDDAVDSPAVRIEIPYQARGGPNPVALLRAAFDRAHGVDGCGGTSGGMTGTGGATGTAESSSTSSDDSGHDDGVDGSDADDASPTSTGTDDPAATSRGTGTSSAPEQADADAHGCAVAPRVRGRERAALLGLLLLVPLGRRRRVR